MNEDTNTIERIFAIVPNNNTSNTITARTHFESNGTFEGCQVALDQYEEKKNIMRSLYQQIGRIVIHEIGGYLQSAVRVSKAEADLATAIGDEEIARGLGIEPMKQGDAKQYDLFLQNVWALSKCEDYGIAHRAVKLIYDHVKDKHKFKVSGKMGGTPLQNLEYILRSFSPGHDPVGGGVIKFSDSAIQYSLTDNGFPFLDNSMNVGDSIIFHPIVFYFKTQSVMVPYASQILDSINENNITFGPDKLTHFSGKSVSELLKSSQLFVEHGF